jgi:8-oxo-dGTP pyrophosphatase MutT (NUDIX family)
VWTGFYRLLFALARAWWFVRRPRTEGAVVAFWCDGRVLLVKSSYRRHYGLPGGFVRRGETHAQAASREVAEELHLQIPPTDLTLASRESTVFEYRHDTTTIWEITLDAPPAIQVDGREIIFAAWKTPAEARALLLLPPVASYFDRRDL